MIESVKSFDAKFMGASMLLGMAATAVVSSCLETSSLIGSSRTKAALSGMIVSAAFVGVAKAVHPLVATVNFSAAFVGGGTNCHQLSTSFRSACVGSLIGTLTAVGLVAGMNGVD